METNPKARALLVYIFFLVYLQFHTLASGALIEQKKYLPHPRPGNHSADLDCIGTGPSDGRGRSAGIPPSTRRPPTPPSGQGGGGHHNYNPPSVPVITLSPPPSAAPYTPIPILPLFPSASPPVFIDPNSPPFTCNYWKTHPALIWGLLGCWGNIGQFFGAEAASASFGSNFSLPQALSNNRSDGIGALFREGTAALLNSIVMKQKFVFTTQQVKDSFNNAVASNRDAAAQAQFFKKANEGYDLKHF